MHVHTQLTDKLMPISATECFQNELGSRMELTLHDDGSLTGLYTTAVGNVPPSAWYRLYGGYDAVTLNSKKMGTIGFVVSWQNGVSNSSSTTSWNGIYDNARAVPEIRTMWLLTSYATPQDEWGSTRIKHDKFRQIKIGKC